MCVGEGSYADAERADAAERFAHAEWCGRAADAGRDDWAWILGGAGGAAAFAGSAREFR